MLLAPSTAAAARAAHTLLHLHASLTSLQQISLQQTSLQQVSLQQMLRTDGLPKTELL